MTEATAGDGVPGRKSSGPGRSALVVHGMVWTTLYEIFAALLNFSAMLVLVRIIPPAEYGRAGAVVGFLTVLNAFSCGAFIAQALQLPDDEEPDWSTHWRAGFFIQLAVSGVCHLMAAFFWFTAHYRPIAPLMHLGGLGLLLDWPNRIGDTMLRRALDFRRLRIVIGAGKLASVFATLCLGLAGWGAFAIVLGANVLPALPCTLELLLVRGWRPQVGWWRWPDWRSYRGALRFGIPRSGSALLHAARGALEAAILPPLLGYGPLGLLQRAQALFTTSIGRVESIFMETVYPLLPRYAPNLEQYSRQALLFLQVVFVLGLPGVIYVGHQGLTLSRVLYGEQWIAADPLIWPSAAAGFGLTVFAAASGILLAANRVRACFYLDVLAASLAVPMVGVALVGGSLIAYVWAVALGQMIAGAVALSIASSLLPSRWMHTVVLPPTVASLLAVVAGAVAGDYLAALPPAVRLSLATLVYGVTLALALRVLFPGVLATVISRLPGGQQVTSSLRVASLTPASTEVQK